MHDNYNVVVFSSQGERPQCNKMSNGDLDGDTYFVCWDAELVSYFDPDRPVDVADNNNNSLKANLRERQPFDRPNEQEIPDHLIWFYKRDNTGQMNNLHLAICDFLGRKGPHYVECQEIAQLCSIAINFGKHGEIYVPNDVKDEKWRFCEGQYPDFMEKIDKPCRRSEGILGKLYRDIRSAERDALEYFKLFDY